jgi:hypothetical protein
VREPALSRLIQIHEPKQTSVWLLHTCALVGANQVLRATMQREVTEPALSRQLPEKVGGVEPADLFRIQAAVGKEPSCTLSNTEIGPL